MSFFNKKDKSANESGSLALLLSTVALSVFVFWVYRTLLNFYYFEFVLIGYMAITTVVLFAYIIYNRGFSRKGLTKDMLPADWSEEKKEEFLGSAQRRLHRSRWLLVILIAFIFTFMLDAADLFLIPLIKGAIGR